MTEQTVPKVRPAVALRYAALSDVGTVRKDNQDSGYAGPWLLTVCDGVGGAARGDIASGTAVQQLRNLDDQPPASEDLLAAVAGALHRAHDRIGELVEDDPSLTGTSTTATVALFDGHRLGIGHVGDSRGYLLRDRTLSQLTTDHTFVQGLIDEGRITEEEARTHPHRNLILKAVDGVHESDPDLFYVEVEAGDRLLLCSDGACGSLTPEELATLLADGTPESAAVEVVQAALEAGSTDNVTAVVADVVPADTAGLADQEPQLVGAAADLARRMPKRTLGRLRSIRPSDTGELDSVQNLPPEVEFAIPSDPLDSEEARYAPRPPRRFLGLRRLLIALLTLAVLAAAAGIAWSWTQRQYFVGSQNGYVTIYRGVDATILGWDLATAEEVTDVQVDLLTDTLQRRVNDTIAADSLTEATRIVNELRNGQSSPEPAPDDSATAVPSPTGSPTEQQSTPPPETGTEPSDLTTVG